MRPAARLIELLLPGMHLLKRFERGQLVQVKLPDLVEQGVIGVLEECHLQGIPGR